jgi:hypothetical protein
MPMNLCLAFALSLLLMLVSTQYAASETPEGRMARTGATGKPPYNIVFIIVDQQTYRLLAGSDYSLQPCRNRQPWHRETMAASIRLLVSPLLLDLSTVSDTTNAVNG